jgi:hypothetical protein
LHRPCRARPADPIPGRGGPERREASAIGRTGISVVLGLCGTGTTVVREAGCLADPNEELWGLIQSRTREIRCHWYWWIIERGMTWS